MVAYFITGSGSSAHRQRGVGLQRPAAWRLPPVSGHRRGHRKRRHGAGVRPLVSAHQPVWPGHRPPVMDIVAFVGYARFASIWGGSRNLPCQSDEWPRSRGGGVAMRRFGRVNGNEPPNRRRRGVNPGAAGRALPASRVPTPQSPADGGRHAKPPGRNRPAASRGSGTPKQQPPARRRSIVGPPNHRRGADTPAQTRGSAARPTRNGNAQPQNGNARPRNGNAQPQNGNPPPPEYAPTVHAQARPAFAYPGRPENTPPRGRPRHGNQPRPDRPDPASAGPGRWNPCGHRRSGTHTSRPHRHPRSCTANRHASRRAGHATRSGASPADQPASGRSR